MPIVLSCPTCRYPISIGEEYAGLTVPCPTCRHPFAVPAVMSYPAPAANPFDVPEDAGEAPSPRRKRRAGVREPMSGQTKFFILVGVLVAVVMGLFIYDRMERYYDKVRLRAINKDQLELLNKISARETEIDMATRARKSKDGEMILPSDYYPKDAEWTRLHDRFNTLEYEREKILRDRPEWRTEWRR